MIRKEHPGCSFLVRTANGRPYILIYPLGFRCNIADEFTFVCKRGLVIIINIALCYLNHPFIYNSSVLKLV